MLFYEFYTKRFLVFNVIVFILFRTIIYYIRTRFSRVWVFVSVFILEISYLRYINILNIYCKNLNANGQFGITIKKNFILPKSRL